MNKNIKLWGLIVSLVIMFMFADSNVLALPLTETNGIDLRQNGPIEVWGDLYEGGKVYLKIPVKNFGTANSPAMHVYTEGDTATGALWRADGANPTAVVLGPGQSVEGHIS